MLCRKSFLSIFLAILGCCLHGALSQASQQYLELYGTSNCAGAMLYNVSETATININGTVPTFSPKPNGLWAIETFDNSTWAQSILRSGIGLCAASFGNGRVTKINVTRYGDSNQNEKKLYLYKDTSLRGIPVTFVDDTPASGSITTVLSWFFTGRHSWSIFSQPNYGGNKVCLNHSLAGGTDSGVSYATSGNIPVGSVKYGCDDGTTVAPPITGTPLTTPTPTITTTRITNTTPRNSTNSTQSTVPPPPNTTSSGFCLHFDKLLLVLFIVALNYAAAPLK